jgi:hypothetical protein
MIPMGALARETGLTLTIVTLDARQQRFTVRLASPYEGSKLKSVHDYPTSGEAICRVSPKEHEGSWEAETMRPHNPDDQPAIKTVRLREETAADREAIS